MIKFSHEANSWQVFHSEAGWVTITPMQARFMVDRGLQVLVHA